eukprot:1149085-Pelagomonas_calceolata.AAC.6
MPRSWHIDQAAVLGKSQIHIAAVHHSQCNELEILKGPPGLAQINVPKHLQKCLIKQIYAGRQPACIKRKTRQSALALIIYPPETPVSSHKLKP